MFPRPMSSLEFRVKLGSARGLAATDARLSAAVSKALADEAVKRVRARVKHPATAALRTQGTNQWSATIAGPRGGPGPIVPVRAKALRFNPGGGFIFRTRVQGAGLGPLIEAETRRVRELFLNITI